MLTEPIAGLTRVAHASSLFVIAVDTYERTLTVDGEETTLIVMDTWESDKQVALLCVSVLPMLNF